MSETALRKSETLLLNGTKDENIPVKKKEHTRRKAKSFSSSDAPKKKKKIQPVKGAEDEPTAAVVSRKPRKRSKVDDDEQRTVFVGNLPIGITKKELKNLFAQSGSIETVRLRGAVSSDPKLSKKAAMIMQKLDPNTSNLIAFVKFKESDSVATAIQLNGHNFAGRRLRVDVCGSGQKKYENKRTAFIGNLPYDAKDDAVFEYFEDCGAIEAVRLIRDKKTGLGKGFGFILFKDPSAVTLALRLNDHVFQGRALRVTGVQKKLKKPQISKRLPNKATGLKSGEKTLPRFKKPRHRDRNKDADSKSVSTSTNDEVPKVPRAKRLKKQRKADTKSFMK